MIFAAAFDRILPESGGPRLRPAGGADRGAVVHHDPVDRGQRDLRVFARLPRVDAGRHAGHRGDLPRKLLSPRRSCRGTSRTSSRTRRSPTSSWSSAASGLITAIILAWVIWAVARSTRSMGSASATPTRSSSSGVLYWARRIGLPWLRGSYRLSPGRRPRRHPFGDPGRIGAGTSRRHDEGASGSGAPSRFHVAASRRRSAALLGGRLRWFARSFTRAWRRFVPCPSTGACAGGLRPGPSRARAVDWQATPAGRLRRSCVAVGRAGAPGSAAQRAALAITRRTFAS